MSTRVPTKKLTGQERFKNGGIEEFSVLDFWQYGFSSLSENLQRGALAEYLVEMALKGKGEIGVRSGWGDYDVLYKGKKIEVKSCSYIQDWKQEKFSIVRWGNFKTTELGYSNAVKKFSELNKTPDYKADIYVLSLLKHQDYETFNILDLDQWCFYVLSQEELKEASGDKTMVSLVRLKKLGYEPVCFSGLAEKINSYCDEP